MLRTEGIVLSEMRYKDTSKILKIYTKKYGKISVMARGAYKPKSILIASTQPFSHNEYLLHKGRAFYYLNQASLIEPFYNIREKVERFLYGSYLMELVDKSTPEEEASEKLFLLLAKALEVLANMEEGFNKFSIAFGLKHISFLGYRPNLGSCSHCGRKDLVRMRFSHPEGGIICQDCFSVDPKARFLDPAMYEAMEALIFTPLDQLDKLKIEDKTLIGLEELVEEYILHSIDRKEFNSLKMLKTLV